MWAELELLAALSDWTLGATEGATDPPAGVSATLKPGLSAPWIVKRAGEPAGCVDKGVVPGACLKEGGPDLGAGGKVRSVAEA